MLLEDKWFHKVFAPSGKSADAGEEKDGISDEEVAAADEAEGKGEDDEFGAGVDDDSATEDDEEVEDDEPEAPSLADVWKQHGVDGLPDDPQEFQRQIAEMRRQSQEAQRYRDYSTLLMQQLQQVNRPQPQPQQPQKPKLPWEVSQFDRRLIDQITTDEAGNLIPKPGAMPDVVDKYRTYQAQRDQAIDKFLADPISVIQDISKDFVSQQAAQIAQRQIYEYKLISELKQFENENRGWAFDKSGQLTQAGEMWNVHYRNALQMGLPDPIQYAEAQFDAQAYRMRLQQDAAKEAAGTDEDAERKKRLELLKRGTRQPNRSGSEKKPGRKSPPQNPKNPFGRLRKQLDNVPPSDFDEK